MSKKLTLEEKKRMMKHYGLDPKREKEITKLLQSDKGDDFLAPLVSVARFLIIRKRIDGSGLADVSALVAMIVTHWESRRDTFQKKVGKIGQKTNQKRKEN